MNCPDIEQLLSPRRRAGIDEHAACCDACGGILGLNELRDQISDRSPEACVDAEILISKREVSALAASDKQRLQNHLEECADCNELAVRMASLPSPVRQATSVAAQTGEFRVERESKRSPAPPLYWWFAAAACALFTGVFGLAMGLALGSEEPAVVAVAPPPVNAPPLPAGAGPKLPSIATPFGVVPIPGAKGQPLPGSTASTDDDSDSDIDQDPVPTPLSSSPLVSPFPSPTPLSSKKVGFVTIMCAPACDEIVAGGRKLGPSPQVRRPLPVGTHAVVLRKGDFTRSIFVRVTEGVITARRVNMNGADDSASDKGAGFFSVTCVPACDKVIAGGRNFGPSPLVRRPLPVGSHGVVLKRGSVTKSIGVTIQKGVTTARRVNMDPLVLPDPAAGKSYGYLNVNCAPHCTKVFVNGKSAGPSPVLRHKLPPGRHVVALWRLTELKSRVVTTHRGKTTKLIHRWTPKQSCSPPYFIDKHGVKRPKPECLGSGGTQDLGSRALLNEHKAILKAKVAAGTATRNEKSMLRALCRQLGDGTCTNVR